MITWRQVVGAMAELSPRDFKGFAERMKAIDPAVGRTVELHAEAADGNSPDLDGWVEGTLRDARALASMEGASVESAIETAEFYWRMIYTDDGSELKNAEAEFDEA